MFAAFWRTLINFTVVDITQRAVVSTALNVAVSRIGLSDVARSVHARRYHSLPPSTRRGWQTVYQPLLLRIIEVEQAICAH